MKDGDSSVSAKGSGISFQRRTRDESTPVDTASKNKVIDDLSAFIIDERICSVRDVQSSDSVFNVLRSSA